MNDADNIYRKALREKLGIGDKKPIREEKPVDVQPKEMVPVETSEDGMTEERLDPKAEAIINDVLQKIDEMDKDENNVHPKNMLKKIYNYIYDNQNKICSSITKGAKK